MDKEKILAAARNEKYRSKELENKESIRSSLLGSAVALVVGIALFLLEYFVQDSVNVGLVAVGMSATGVDALYEGFKLKRHYMTVIGVSQMIIAILAILLFIAKVVTA